MYYKVSEICIGGHFLEDCFYCYSQQIVSVVANESLNAYNFIKRVPEKQAFNTVTPNANPNQIKINATNTAIFLDQKILFYRNINNKNTCKIVCKMECLKNRL